jgi:hypothetical protein
MPKWIDSTFGNSAAGAVVIIAVGNDFICRWL